MGDSAAAADGQDFDLARPKGRLAWVQHALYPRPEEVQAGAENNRQALREAAVQIAKYESVPRGTPYNSGRYW